MYVVNGTAVPVAWPASSFPIRYVVDSRVNDAFPKGVINRAINDWTTVPDSQITFQDAGVVTGAKPGRDGQNSITFVDDLFKDQNFLAVTTNWYDNDGRLAEADIQIDPSVVPNGYNLQQLVEHEVGHLLGLDHSGVISSVMYPFVGRGGIAQLDSDDRVGIANLYPAASAKSGATLTGRVMGDSGGIFAAQVVALNDSDEPVATALTDNQGAFEIDGVPPGTYQLYAEPLDGPVNLQNLAGIWQSAKAYSFPTEFASGGPLRVDAGRIYGNLVVNTSGTTTLNPKWIGIFAPGTSNVSLGCMPVSIGAGQTMNVAIGGDGFISGMTTFDIPNPSFRRVSDFSYAGNYVYATFNVSPTASPSSLVVLVKNGNDSAALTGALRVVSQVRTRVAHR
jgi:matrixin/carboxypeptidase family protein